MTDRNYGIRPHECGPDGHADCLRAEGAERERARIRGRIDDYIARHVAQRDDPGVTDDLRRVMQHRITVLTVARSFTERGEYTTGDTAQEGTP